MKTYNMFIFILYRLIKIFKSKFDDISKD